MAILNWKIQFPDQAADALAQQTRIGTMACNDNLNFVLASGYLNQIVTSGNQGGLLLPTAGYVPLPQDLWFICYNGGAAMFSTSIVNGVVSLSLAAGNSNSASIAISSAQFLGMYAAPVALLPAPGANKVILVNSMQLIMKFGTTDYASGGVVAAQYDSTVHGAGVLATNSEAAADFFAAANAVFSFNRSALILPSATTVNKGLYLSNATGAFTTGDSTFTANVNYSIFNVA